MRLAGCEELAGRLTIRLTGCEQLAGCLTVRLAGCEELTGLPTDSVGLATGSEELTDFKELTGFLTGWRAVTGN